MYAPSKLGEQPSIEVSKEFMMKPNKIHLEASLDKEVSKVTGLGFIIPFLLCKNCPKNTETNHIHSIAVISSWRNGFGKRSRGK